MTDKLKRESDLKSSAPSLFASRRVRSPEAKPFRLVELNSKRREDVMIKPLPKPNSPLFFRMDQEEQKSPVTFRSYESSTSEKACSISVPTTPQKYQVKESKDSPHGAFSKRLRDMKCSTVAHELQQEFSRISGQIFLIWHSTLQLITMTPRFVLEYLQ